MSLCAIFSSTLVESAGYLPPKNSGVSDKISANAACTACSFFQVRGTLFTFCYIFWAAPQIFLSQIILLKEVFPLSNQSASSIFYSDIKHQLYPHNPDTACGTRRSGHRDLLTYTHKYGHHFEKPSLFLNSTGRKKSCLKICSKNFYEKQKNLTFEFMQI